MIFKLSTAGTYYNKEDKERLTQLGFRFNRASCTSDWRMDSEVHPTIDIANLDGLIEFIRRAGSEVIINLLPDGLQMVIYDDNVE